MGYRYLIEHYKPARLVLTLRDLNILLRKSSSHMQIILIHMRLNPLSFALLQRVKSRK